MRLPGLATCVLCSLLCANTGVAQTKQRPRKFPSRTTDSGRQKPKREPAAPPMPILPDLRSDPDVQDADVAIIANITAKELKFDAVPNPSVEFLAKDKTQTVWHADRYNLPDKVEPGVTYRNVGIRLKITSRLADIDRIVAEALGEIPASDPTNETKSPGSKSVVSAGSSNQKKPIVIPRQATPRGPK